MLDLTDNCTVDGGFPQAIVLKDTHNRFGAYENVSSYPDDVVKALIKYDTNVERLGPDNVQMSHTTDKFHTTEEHGGTLGSMLCFIESTIVVAISIEYVVRMYVLNN